MTFNTTLFAIQSKCARYIGSETVDVIYKQLNKERESAFLLQFKESSVGNRVKIHEGVNTVPYNGFTFYKITYKGVLPDAREKAYRKMDEFNDESPRAKYRLERKKIR